jgi:hypothetical protein
MTTETTDQQDAQEPQDNAPEAQEQPQTREDDQQLNGQQDDVQEPQDSPEQSEEEVDWSKLAKTRNEASNLRKRARTAETERDEALEKLTELEAKVAEYEAADEQREIDTLRRRVLTERNFPESTLELLTGTTEEEIIAELDRAVAILTQATPGPILRGTTGEVSKEADWSSVVKGR